MEEKVNAVKKIKTDAEAIALDYEFDANMTESMVDLNIEPLNASLLIDESVDKESTLLQNAITWSSNIVNTFEENTKKDPSLGSQKFSSSNGFSITYPKKEIAGKIKDPRMTESYTQSASSSKVS